jgi:hypothetical protein
MKALKVTAIIISGLIVTCSDPFTTKLSLSLSDDEQIEEKLLDYKKEEATGAEVTLLLKNVEEFNGELLSVRDSSILVCAKYSATEKELASLKYTINVIQTDNLLEIKIEGNNFPFWIGAGIGFVAGTTVYLVVKDDINFNVKTGDEEDADKALSSCCLVVVTMGLPVLIGKVLSTENVTLTHIPPGSRLLPLKSLARYQDAEPEYLRTIK